MGLNVAILNQKLENNLFGRHIVYHQQTASTNDDAFLLAMQGANEGTAVLADSQHKGRGRYQRRWHSPSGKNIYLSIILRPAMHPQEASRIPILAGVAMAETIERFCSAEVSLKWPNDVLLEGKKVCGILSQLKTADGRIHFIVVGIGLNVNMRCGDFPAELSAKATSIAMETGVLLERENVIIILFENLAKWYKKLLTTGFEEIKAAWMERTNMIGKNIKISCLGGGVIRGQALGIDDNGSLLLINDAMEIISVSAGDATVLKE
jgi:BirA family biotin operon repressor/biotin-[acetyl-CoA-carboxylase] ligase